MSAAPSLYFKNKPHKLIAESEAAGAFIITQEDGSKYLFYEPQPKQRLYHASTVPNLIMQGRRGTGKSLAMRMDFHMRALACPGFTYLILRRTMPELRKSHLLFIDNEMKQISHIPGFEEARYLKGVSEAHYGNGSIGLFGHCETEADVLKYLSAQFAGIAFDEITTFDWDMITKISTSCRVTPESGLTAIVRGGTNPLGVSAEDVYRYFIAKDVTIEEDPNYFPDDWDNIELKREDNIHLDHDQYDKKFAGLPEAYRKAWLDGVWGVEGAYFSLRPEHSVATIPTIAGPTGLPPMPALQWPWLHVYRLLDWGWHDPTVCLWVAVLPNGREIPFQEQTWLRTPAKIVAADIRRLSDGMRVITTIADPTLWDGEKEMDHSLADEFEYMGVSLTKGVNNRTAAGFAIQEHLNQILPDGLPKLQIYEDGKYGCPTLIRALRAMRVDKKHPGRIADHKMDHLPICLGYFCMAGVGPTQVPNVSITPRWMQKQTAEARILGANNVRTARV